jgi:glyoxylase-like metal-dependent hydrolase (beta-lactamase superfamily II)
VEIKTTRLAPDFYTLEGQGGTISVLTGPDGVLLVDSQFAPLTDKLVAAIAKLSDKPIRFLIDTHVHGDHTGGNENFAKRGVLIFSRDQLRHHSRRLIRARTKVEVYDMATDPALDQHLRDLVTRHWTCPHYANVTLVISGSISRD